MKKMSEAQKKFMASVRGPNGQYAARNLSEDRTAMALVKKGYLCTTGGTVVRETYKGNMINACYPSIVVMSREYALHEGFRLKSKEEVLEEWLVKIRRHVENPPQPTKFMDQFQGRHLRLSLSYCALSEEDSDWVRSQIPETVKVRRSGPGGVELVPVEVTK